MIQVAANRSQYGLIALAVLGILFVVFMATYRPLPAQPVSSAGPTEGALASSSRPSSTPGRSPDPSLSTPSPTLGTCSVPLSLPRGGATEATPLIDGGTGSMVFASPVYRSSAGGPVAADDPAGDWEMGLWFVPAPGEEPRLLTSAGRGMVIPLALAPSGDMAAVWWWPERRGLRERECESGIYVINTGDRASRLIREGDWSVTVFENSNWTDPTTHASESQPFNIPKAGFSPDGSLVAIVDGDLIDIYRSASPDQSLRHVGACTTWAWAPTGHRFAAGCEDMTSAWVADDSCCDGGMAARSFAIPRPTIDRFPNGWENASTRAIGFTADGDVRVVRTYGQAIGCEGPGSCEIPAPAWAVTTIDWDTGAIVHGGAASDFLFDYGSVLSADASWLYGIFYDDDNTSITIDLATGTTRQIGLLGNPAGATLDGSTLYGWVDDESVPLVIRAVTPRSVTGVAEIRWPDGSIRRSDRILVVGMWVAGAT